MKKFLYITGSILLLLFVSTYVFMLQKDFGKSPDKNRIQQLEKSGYYIDNAVNNISHTPQFNEGENGWTVTWKFLTQTSNRLKPSFVLPSVKNDLKNIDRSKFQVVWFGHSSYLIFIEGKTILVDPVFSGSAAPIAFFNKSFKGTDVYTAEDMPEIDYLVITHDHWDHLDYETVKKLQPKVKKVITGMGTGAHLEYWGYDTSKIVEGIWYQSFKNVDGFDWHICPARHFSGRTFDQNKTMWVSMMAVSPSGKKIFIGGDTGYDTFFKDIQNKYGTPDMAFLECGQYDIDWRYIHMMPEETVQAAIDLGAKYVLPVHWGKFAMGKHAWDESIQRFSNEARLKQIRFATPRIGELVFPDDSTQKFQEWWK